ncbi:DNA-directed RNA polymerase III subunit C53 KNAG_0C03890 [Huiozyma naganishii CBS 8797]|uniref:DNA-directed RNA polymerase III subunit RPC4 n=1 Tax=Huiozyma naganishii (strain ATCC MYA-139 / BCRC 22969 / CBS 8797 / KCTC 17520 / NBRC 10181 / NCYC 3082 / Yp74L-3) TaxID=1071383 RepID=J7RJ15_HUIN7|nr:hypothetical protein KNAG_0C03890 [Kazachstania naganishii CBS 8797]CCK69493.1 hypothetical protein KNAG_0C03890 [Kazachstania naganishii CBS 8797]
MSGRLPSLRDAASSKKSTPKFKPKTVARKSKEEREANAARAKTEKELADAREQLKKKQGPAPPGERKKRVPKYLTNTHVVSSGPLAAGNFVGESGNRARSGFTSSGGGGGSGGMSRGFVKMEGGNTSLVHKGLETIENHAHQSDSEPESDQEDKNTKHSIKFNMGREYKVGETNQDLDNYIEGEDDDGELETEDLLHAKRIEQLFPVRPLRVKHDDVDALKRHIQESVSVATTREQTPKLVPELPIKSEEEPTLDDQLRHRESELQHKLSELNVDTEFGGIDVEETRSELSRLAIDYKRIRDKVLKIDNKPNRFMLFQLPHRLPAFQDITPKTEEGSGAAAEDDVPEIPTEEHSTEKNTEESKIKSKRNQHKKKKASIPQNELVGAIGTLRVHKSGKISVEIGGIPMEVSSGAETSFLQDLVALNAPPEITGSEEEPATGLKGSIEHLGKIESKIVVTPKI